MELNQFLLIAGGLLVVSLILLVGGIMLYRNRQEEDAPGPDKRARIGTAAAVLPEEAAGGETGPPATSPDPSENVHADPPPDPGPMLKGPVAGAPQMTRKPIPEKGPAGASDPPAGRVEILRVYRDPFDAELSLQVLGQQAQEVEQMSAAQLAQLKRVLAEIFARVEKAPGTVGEGAAGERAGDIYKADQASSRVAGDEGGATAGGSGSVKPSETFADSLPQQPEIREMLFPRRKAVMEKSEPPEPPKSIAEQIDEIVQSLLPNSSLNGQQIRLSEVPGGGLLIVHNGQRYQGIEEVEDPDAHALIKKAVQVWNERNKLG